MHKKQMTGARTPIGASGNFLLLLLSCYHCYSKPTKGLSKGSEILHGLLTNKNIRIPINNKNYHRFPKFFMGF